MKKTILFTLFVFAAAIVRSHAQGIVPDTVQAADSVGVAVIPDTAVAKITDNAIPDSGRTHGSAPTDTAVAAVQAAPPATADTAPAPAPPRPRSKEELKSLSREELYSLAFGGAAPERPRSLLMRLFADNIGMGNTEIVYEADFSFFRFQSSRLSRYLDTLILRNKRSIVGDSVDNYFSSADLVAAGYGVVVNDLAFELHIAAPPEHKVMQRLNLGGGYEARPRGEKIDPALVSFYANYRLSNRSSYRVYDYSSDYKGFKRADEGFWRNPAILDVDGALTVLGTVLEASAWVYEPSEGERFTQDNYWRGDVRLVRDFVPLNSRAMLGDVSLGNELLTGETVGGLSYEHNKWFFGNDPRDDRNSVTFFMNRPGFVEIYVNNRFEDRFRLPAGHHNIKGFSGDVGHNNVRLILRLDDGSTEEVPFDFVLSNPRNLPKGDLHYSVAAGFRRDPIPAPSSYEYDLQDPAVSAYMQYGLHHAVSVGLAGQSSNHTGIFGARALWSVGDLSSMTLLGSVSYVGYDRAVGRADLNYNVNFRRSTMAINRFLTNSSLIDVLSGMALSFRGYFQSAFYSNNLFNSEVSNSASTFGISGSLGLGVYKGSVSLGGGLIYSADTINDGYDRTGYDYNIRVAQSVNKVTFSLSAGERVSYGMRNPYVSIHSNYALGLRYRKHNFTASSQVGMNSKYIPASTQTVRVPDSLLSDPGYDGPRYVDKEIGERTEYNWRWGANAGWRWANNGSGIGAQSYHANVGIYDMLTDISPTFGAGLSHTYNRAALTAGYNFGSADYPTYTRDIHDMNATFAGSFMFADGLWALGRPVNGGFVLVDTRQSLKDATIHVDRGGAFGRSFSKTGLLGAAYKNNVMQYHPSQLTLTMINAPIGAMLQNNQYYVVSGYKQGHALRVGTDGGVMLYTRFVMADGKPVSYVHATIEQVSGRGDFNRRATFTGADGSFQAIGLRRGNAYRIKFGGSAGLKDAVIVVPADAELIYELDDIKVEAAASAGGASDASD